MTLTISESVLNKFEKATIGALRFSVAAIGADALSAIIAKTKEESVSGFLTQYDISNNADIPQVKLWTEIFEVMSAKKGRESSIVYLSNYVLEKKELFDISPFVDLYNSISLKYGIPMGGYNASSFIGDIQLRLARKGEEFCGIGSKQIEKTSANEVVYSDEQGVFCRYWNDKDCDRTKITDDIADILFIFDGINQVKEIGNAVMEIKSLLMLSDYKMGIADKTISTIHL